MGFESIRVLQGVGPEIAADPARRPLARAHRDRRPRRRRLDAALRRRLLPSRPDGRPARLPAGPARLPERDGRGPLGPRTEQRAAAPTGSPASTPTRCASSAPTTRSSSSGARHERASRGAVVVTGSSTGIGRACALGLDRAGFTVFAGVRKPEDGEALAPQASERLEPLIDRRHRRRDSIAAAAERSREATGGRLAGLVNNAGVAVPGPVEARAARRATGASSRSTCRPDRGHPGLPGDDPRRPRPGRLHLLDRRARRAPLPLALQRLQGSDRGGRRLAAPGDAPVRGRGLDHRAGLDRDPIWDKGSRRGAALREAMDAGDERALRRRARPRRGGVGDEDRRHAACPPSAVAEAVVHALTAEKPKARYLVGTRGQDPGARPQLLPDRVFDRLVAREIDAPEPRRERYRRRSPPRMRRVESRRRRHGHELDAAAGRRRRGRPRARDRAALDRDPARPRRRHLRPARGRGDRGRLRGGRRLHRPLRGSASSGCVAIATSAVRDAANSRDVPGRAARALRPRRARSSTAPRRRGSPTRRLRRAPAGREDAGRRHRRRLDRARDRRRPRGRLLRLAAGRDRPPHRAPHHPRPARGRRARGAGRRRPRPDRRGARGRGAGAGQLRHRRRRHADLAGGDRPAARPLRPRAASTATGSRSSRSSGCSPSSPSMPLAERLAGPGPARGPGADDRRRGRDPDRR